MKQTIEARYNGFDEREVLRALGIDDANSEEQLLTNVAKKGGVVALLTYITAAAAVLEPSSVLLGLPVLTGGPILGVGADCIEDIQAIQNLRVVQDEAKRTII